MLKEGMMEGIPGANELETWCGQKTDKHLKFIPCDIRVNNFLHNLFT